MRDWVVFNYLISLSHINQVHLRAITLFSFQSYIRKLNLKTKIRKNLELERQTWTNSCFPPRPPPTPTQSLWHKVSRWTPFEKTEAPQKEKPNIRAEKRGERSEETGAASARDRGWQAVTQSRFRQLLLLIALRSKWRTDKRGARISDKNRDSVGRAEAIGVDVVRPGVKIAHGGIRLNRGNFKYRKKIPWVYCARSFDRVLDTLPLLVPFASRLLMRRFAPQQLS